MEKYKITFKKSVTKDFKTLPKADIKKFSLKLTRLLKTLGGRGRLNLAVTIYIE